MIREEKARSGAKADFEVPDIEIDEIKPDIMLVDRDLILTHELGSSRKENLRLIIAPDSTINIIEEFKGESSYADFSTEITVGDNSRVNYFIKQELSKNSTLYQNCFFTLNKNSRLELLNLINGCRQLKHRTIVHLNGEGAECKNNCVCFASQEQKFIIETSNIHHKKNTTSKILTKGILDGKSKMISTGIIKIRANAEGSDGYQKGDYLLLSKTAELNSIPELEIKNHDVKCSHGVTISRISDEKVFYLASRGIREEEAKKMLVKGFIVPALGILPRERQEQILEHEK